MWDFYYDKCHWRNLKNSITLLSFAKVVKMVTAFLWKHFFCAAFNKCLNWRSCSTGCVQNFSNKMISDSALIYYSNKPQIVHHFIYSFPNATSNERTTNGNYTPKQHFTILNYVHNVGYVASEIAVVNQQYDPEVQNPAAFIGSNVLMKCNIPTFVKSYVSVISWLQEPSFNIYPATESGKFWSIFFFILVSYQRNKLQFYRPISCVLDGRV